MEALGRLLSGAATAIQDKVQAPLSMCAQSVLAGATLAVQGHADIVLPTGQGRPLSLFLVSVAASGDRKSACDCEALLPIRAREKERQTEYWRELPKYQNQKAAYDRLYADTLKKAKGDPGSIAAALEALGAMPRAPLNPLLTAPDPTFEGLVKLLAEGQPSVGIFSAEAGQFIGGYGMSEERKIATAAAISCLWDGEPVRRVRAGDGITYLQGRRICAHLMAQPGVMAEFLADRILLDQGLLSRILPAAPVSLAGTRLWHEPKPESLRDLESYRQRFSAILETPMPIASGTRNVLAPRQLPLSTAARQVWVKFSDHVEGELGDDGPLAPIRGFASKLPEHAARLAGVIALADDLSVNKVGAEQMEAGIVVAQFYAAEAIRLFECGRIDPQLLDAQRVLDWLRLVWKHPAVSLPDIYQLGPNSIRCKEKASKIVRVLEDHGYLVRIPGGAVCGGKPRREAWAIVQEG
ncbi:MAG TPA: YfjI family protein [Stellaceae bacterium]|nr:YfjI family protein [Stellaceae bacterium]